MMKPTATTCRATLCSMPNRPQASGMSIREPPGTPEAPQAHTAATKERKMAVQMSGLIASLQSTDGGAALTRQLKDAGELDDKELTIFATFQMTADAPITNFLGSGVILFGLTTAAGELAVPPLLGACLGIILLGKVFAANVMRFGLYRFTK